MKKNLFKSLAVVAITAIAAFTFVINGNNIINNDELALENALALELAYAECSPGDYCELGFNVCLVMPNGDELAGNRCAPAPPAIH